MVIVLFVACMLVLIVLWMMSLNATVEDFFADRVDRREPSDPRAICKYSVFTFPNVDDYGFDEYGTPCSVTLGLVGDSKSRIHGSYYYHNTFGVPSAEVLTAVRPKARMRNDDEIDLPPPW